MGAVVKMLKRVIPAGPKIYFPNFVFTLIRSGKERPPDQVVFRVPRILNKLDIRQYLEGLYNVRVKNIHSFNFLGKTTRGGRNYRPAKKNVIVTLEGATFTYPPPPDSSRLMHPLPNMNNWPKIHK